MQQTVTVAELARRAAEQQDLMRSLARVPGGANAAGRGYQQYLARYFANAGRGTGPGMYNWAAAGPGHVLGRAGNAAAGAGAGAGAAAAAFNVPAHVLQVDPFQAAHAPPFTAEEYAEMERQGIPLPLPTRYLQEQGLIRRPGEELPPSSILQRGLGALALGGLLAGSPGAAVAGTGGLIVHNAFQGPALGPSQLRIPAATRRASFSNRAAVREFHHRDPTYATGAGFGTNSTAATLNVRNNRYPSRPSSSVPGKMKATLGSPPGLEDADVRNGPSGAMRYPRPNRRGTANNNRRNGNYRRNVARDPWVQNPRAAEAVARQRAADVEKNEKISAATNAMIAAGPPPVAPPAAPPAPPVAPPAPPASSFFNRFFKFGGTRRLRKAKKANSRKSRK